MDPDQQRTTAAGLQQGDTDAWRILYDTYAARVWHLVAIRVGPDTNGIGDIVQETFLAAARSARQFDPGKGTLWAWLRGIAYRQGALYFRKEQRHHQIPSRDGRASRIGAAVLDWLAGDTPGPPESYAIAERAQLVRDAFQYLSDEYTILLTARYFEGTRIDLLADQFASTPTAIRSKLARARRAFRKALRQVGSSETFPACDNSTTKEPGRPAGTH